MQKRVQLDLDEDFDVEGFEPKARHVQHRDEIKKTAAEVGFPSRQQPKRRVHRTGRDTQFNAKVRPDVRARFYAIAEEQGWVMGETLEHALAALERELGTT